MQFFETLLTLVVGLLVVAIASQGTLNKSRFKIFALACCLLIAHLALETTRWQMIMTYVIGTASTLLLLKTSVSRVVVRTLGTAFALMLLATTVFLTAQFPMLRLPSPEGPYAVGTTTYSLTDSSRMETFTGDSAAKRELFVEVWYPADETVQLPTPKPLWSELYRGMPDRVSMFMSYMRGIPTHSYPDVPPRSIDGSFPLIIFNHGLQMFTAQNMILMEHLASNGYVVVSIGHPYESLRVNLPQAGTVLPPFITSREKFKEAMNWIEKSSVPVNEAKRAMKLAETRAQRAEIMLAAIENSAANDTVDVWVKDSQFVLNDLASANGARYRFQHCIDFDRVGAIGMSIGGAVAVELCKADDRFCAGINIDGLAYGARRKDKIHVPFMMLYSDEGLGVNDFLMLQSEADYYEYHVLNTRHSDFTDLSLVWPIMRTTGQLGEVSARRMNFILNQTTQAFMDRYLKQLNARVPTGHQIPEMVGMANVSPFPSG